MNPTNYFNFYSETVNINDIDFEFTPFSFSYGFELDQIIKSIQKVGLINYPILKKEGDRFIIVTGYKRLLALKKLGWPRVKCRIMAQDIPFLECLLISLYENITTRDFNDIEKAILLSRLSQYLTRDQIIQEYMPLLRLPRYDHILDMYIWIDRDLQDDIKMLVIKERISINTLRRFFEWGIPKEDLKVYSWILSNLKLSQNQQKEFVEYSYDVCKEKKISLEQFFSGSGIRDIIKNNSLNINDKTKKILYILRQARFPRLYEAKNKFDNIIKKMNLPDNVVISASPYFESPYYKMEISFRNGRELRHKIKKLNDIRELEEIRDPW